eukprot:CAMPEP_0205830404 /NCGR_PEP_ID=MMETSP0206-20130828/40936_1 /ASSEMBLY_ACC=CAM_ASM_000279 /TAXON_ID=36767 /ORGANISM="Euplotes focardii, Strain TN1" /LENGTH=411 /DNA_ID=CAMNT_0053134027 /DNA_START=44 /DNA_END=1279 /DNA_ORIENTATION=+
MSLRTLGRLMRPRAVTTRGFAAGVQSSTNFGADGQIVPHGGALVESMAPAELSSFVLKSCSVEIDLNDRQACDVELLVNGAFSPLGGFMNQDDYDSVVSDYHLKSGELFGLPVVLDVNRDDIVPGTKVALNYQGKAIAALEVESRWNPDKPLETLRCYQTSSLEHPGVQMVAMERGPTYVGGNITGLAYPDRVFPCQTPREVRAGLPKNADVVVFQCRNPVHRAHYELFTRAGDAENVSENGVVLVHPTCGPTQADDIPGAVRYATYEVLKNELEDKRINWAYLPYSMHMAGPREALQHMLIRKNYGCTHFIIGRDMAGSKSSVTGDDFYGAYDAQDFAKSISGELGMQTVPSLNLVYTDEGYLTAEAAKERGLNPLKLSGTEFRRKLRAGEDIPEWFAFKSVVEVLRAHQ